MISNPVVERGLCGWGCVGGHVAFQEMSTSHVSVTHSPHVTY